jgi:hypothetical protein
MHQLGEHHRRRQSASLGRSAGISRRARTGKCSWVPQEPLTPSEPVSGTSVLRVCRHTRHQLLGKPLGSSAPATVANRVRYLMPSCACLGCCWCYF